MRHSLFVILLMVVALSPLPAFAQTQCSIEVDQTDTPLDISGWLGEENAFIGNVRLTALCEEGVENFHFLASDLKRAGDDTVIGRQNVTLIGDTQLEGNVPKDFQVRVTGVSVPGTYSGNVRLQLPGQTQSEAKTINVNLVAKAPPALTALPGAAPVQVRLVNCGGWLDCPLAHLVLPDSAFLDELPLRFDNTTQGPVTVVDIESAVMDEQSRYQLTDQHLKLPQGEQIFPPQRISTLLMGMNRPAITAGRYTGALYMTLDGSTARFQVPVDLSVRTGPFLPLLVLLLGIVLLISA
jgi:hypothetical protein